MRLLLDTNVLLWTLSGSARIRKIRNLILADDSEIYVSTASLWEIAIKSGIGKLDADVGVIRRAIQESGFIELAVFGSHIETVATLPLHHRDPFDRLIIAQAMTEPMRLLTGDATLAIYSDLVETI